MWNGVKSLFILAFTVSLFVSFILKAPLVLGGCQILRGRSDCSELNWIGGVFENVPYTRVHGYAGANDLFWRVCEYKGSYCPANFNGKICYGNTIYETCVDTRTDVVNVPSGWDGKPCQVNYEGPYGGTCWNYLSDDPGDDGQWEHWGNWDESEEGCSKCVFLEPYEEKIIFCDAGNCGGACIQDRYYRCESACGAHPDCDEAFPDSSPSGRIPRSCGSDDGRCKDYCTSTCDYIPYVCEYDYGADLECDEVPRSSYLETCSYGNENKIDHCIIWCLVADTYCESDCPGYDGAPSCDGKWTGDSCGGGICGANCNCCGNGIVESGEQCDDGNTLAGDCCSSTCQYEAAGTDCGLCKACDGSGNCNQMPADDPDCGTIDCDGLNDYYQSGTESPTGTETCYYRDYADITSNRCEGFGNCKDANTADCTDYSDSYQYECRTCKYISATSCTGTTLGSCSNYGTSSQCNSAYACSPGSGDNNYGAGGDYRCQGYCDGGGSCDYAGNCENCNDYDCTTGITCTQVDTDTIREDGDDYSCSAGSCVTVGTMTCDGPWDCTTGDCSTRSCGVSTYYCYMSNAGILTWVTSPEATETACDDGYDNDCDGLTDAADPDCGAACGNGICDAGETWSDCPQDCCKADCTGCSGTGTPAVCPSDSTCHSICNNKNGCLSVTSGCNGKSSGSTVCDGAEESNATCCEGSFSDCGTEYWQCCFSDGTDCGEQYVDYGCFAGSCFGPTPEECTDCGFYTCSDPSGRCTSTCSQACGAECDGPEDCPSGICKSDCTCEVSIQCDYCIEGSGGNTSTACGLTEETPKVGVAQYDEEWYWLDCWESAAGQAKAILTIDDTLGGEYELCIRQDQDPDDCPQVTEICVDEIDMPVTVNQTSTGLYWVLAHRKNTVGDAGFEITLDCYSWSPPYSCSDTDGGVAPKIKGTVSGYQAGSPYNYTDECQTSRYLTEYYCSGTSPTNQTYDCYNYGSSYICSSGRCKYQSSGGVGCPTLFVYDGKSYVKERKSRIHSEEGIDTVDEIVLKTMPVAEGGVYSLSLRETTLPEHSHIDSVKLFVDGEEVELISAMHSRYGDVTKALAESDDVRTDTKVFDSIDLKFKVPELKGEVNYFLFEIEGYNPRGWGPPLKLDITHLIAVFKGILGLNRF